jgi:predicted PurR-regulated permease PerM
MQGQLILSLIIGVLGYLWLSIFQVPYAFLIAIFAAIIEIVPVFGSVISGIVAVVIATSHGGAELGLIIAVGFLVINLLQSNLIYPLVVKRVVGVPPIMVILAMIAGGQIAGFLGVLLSVPIAAAIQEFVSDIERAKAKELKALQK